MQTYPDGTTINVGDHVWWNEGTCVGYVAAVIETDEQIAAWGLTGASIAVSLGGTVVYPMGELTDEAVGLLSANEESEFSLVEAVALASQPGGHSGYAWCVTVSFDEAIAEAHWHFYFLDQMGSLHSRVSVPVRPGTR